MSIPSPTLVSLIPANLSVIANWVNNPLIDIFNAYLLVVNTNDYSMRYIYLSLEEAQQNTYTITGLLNNTKYLVEYTQTQNAPDGVQGSSNTLSATPNSLPAAPVLINDIAHPVVVTPLGGGRFNIQVWADYGLVPYNPQIEYTYFKVVAENVEDISTNVFPVTYPLSRYIQYTIPNVPTDAYALTAYNVNNIGQGPLSNVLTVYAGVLPAAPIQSGPDSGNGAQIAWSAHVNVNVIAPNQSVNYYVSTDDINYTLAGTGSYMLTIGGYDYFSTITYTSVTQGTPYYVKTAAVNAYGEGPLSTANTGVPATHSGVLNGNPGIVINGILSNGDGTYNVDISFTAVTNTYPIAAYNYQLIRVDTSAVILQGSTISTSLTLVNQVGFFSGMVVLPKYFTSDVVDTADAAFWTYPPLMPGNIWNNGQVGTGPVYSVGAAPPAPINVAATDLSPTSLTYTWFMPSAGYNDPTSYNVQLATDASFNDLVANNFLSPTQTASFSGLTTGTNYWFRIMASNQYGSTVWVYASHNPDYPDALPTNPGGLKIAQGPELGGFYPVIGQWDRFVPTSDYSFLSYNVTMFENNVTVQNFTVTDISQCVVGYMNGVVGREYRYTMRVATQSAQLGGSTIYTDTANSPHLIVSLGPLISNVVFGVDGVGNGTLSFEVNDNGNLLTGMVSMVLPVPSYSGSVAPVQTSYIYVPGTHTYNVNLGYPIPAINPGYCIYCCNIVGQDVLFANLS